MRFHQLADEYLQVEAAARGWSPAYVSSQRAALRSQVLPVVADRDVEGLTRGHFAALADTVRRYTSPGYTQLVLGTVSRVWKYGVDAGYIPTESRGLADLAAKQASRQGQQASFIDPSARPDSAAVENLVAALSWPYSLAALVSAYAGLRFGEVFALEAGDVDLDAGTIEVARQVTHPGGEETIGLPKHGKTRTTFVPERLEGPLAQVRGQEGRLFPTPSGQYVRASNFYRRYFRPACEQAGWPKNADGTWRWSWHSLRHHFCTWLLGRGLPVEDVALFAGHSSPAVTLSTYVGVADDATARARNLTKGA